jgi:hypothetical protein
MNTGSFIFEFSSRLFYVDDATGEPVFAPDSPAEIFRQIKNRRADRKVAARLRQLSNIKVTQE